MTKTAHDSEVAAHGQQVITACALIHRLIDGKPAVFLPRRADSKKFLPGVYEIPGGHIDYGENIVAGLKREIREEFDVEVRVGDPFCVFDYTNAVKGSHSLEVIYFATLVDKPDDIKLHAEDHSTYGWFSQDELDQVYSAQKTAGDDEFAALRRAFELLAGSALDTTGA